MTSSEKLSVTYSDWIRLHLRLAAVERSGELLSCRFEFPAEDKLICRLCFVDQEANPLTKTSASERREIYEGWIHFGRETIKYALTASGLPSSLVWDVDARFELDVKYGMGTSLVHAAEQHVSWPSLRDE